MIYALLNYKALYNEIKLNPRKQVLMSQKWKSVCNFYKYPVVIFIYLSTKVYFGEHKLIGKLVDLTRIKQD